MSFSTWPRNTIAIGSTLAVEGRDSDECGIVLARETDGETDRVRSMADDETRKLCLPECGIYASFDEANSVPRRQLRSNASVCYSNYSSV